MQIEDDIRDNVNMDQKRKGKQKQYKRLQG